MGIGEWAKSKDPMQSSLVDKYKPKRSAGKSFGDRTYEKFEKTEPGPYPYGRDHAYAEFASKQAWKTNSVAAHDEAAKAHDGAAFGGSGYMHDYHREKSGEHDEATMAIQRGEKPSKGGTADFDEEKHLRDSKGRFAPK